MGHLNRFVYITIYITSNTSFFLVFKVVEVLQMIFDSPGRYPTLEELVLCDLFRNIDLREMRGTRVPV